jgi:hypothetical protein
MDAAMAPQPPGRKFGMASGHARARVGRRLPTQGVREAKVGAGLPIATPGRAAQ